MPNGSSGTKRKAAASGSDVPSKLSTNALVSEEVAALLRTVASSLNAATLGVMNLQCADIAARGREVAVMSDCKRQLDNILGIKRRGSSVLAINEQIIDVFKFLRRQELDALQIVSVRFNAIVETKMTLVCLRLLRSAKISRISVQRQFVLIMDEVGATKKTRLPAGVTNEPAATRLLFSACRSSRVDSLELYGTKPMNVDFFDSLALIAPTIFVDEFCMGKRTLCDVVAHDKVLGVLQTFAELERVKSSAVKDANLQNCLVRTCFKAGVTLDSDGLILGKQCDTTVVEDALLEFCFGECDEQYATRERELVFPTLPKNDFMQRWIEKAEVHNCRHKLTLEISHWQGMLRQDTAALDVYKRSQTHWECDFESVSGRHWTAKYTNYGVGGGISFKINH